jgi:hypothetical protein
MMNDDDDECWWGWAISVKASAYNMEKGIIIRVTSNTIFSGLTYIVKWICIVFVYSDWWW